MAPQGVAVITGGTKGLGRALSLRFGRAGYSVVAIFHSDDPAARNLERELQGAGISGLALRHDVATEGLAAKLAAVPGFADATSYTLIHAACAPFSPKPLHLLGQELEEQFRTAVVGGLLTAQAMLRFMVRRKRGTIVEILSTAVGDTAPKGFLAYVSAKYALLGLSKCLDAEYAHLGIRVLTVSPGFMNTSLTAGWDPSLRAAIAAHQGGAEDPAHVADRIYRLVSRDSPLVASE